MRQSQPVIVLTRIPECGSTYIICTMLLKHFASWHLKGFLWEGFDAQAELETVPMLSGSLPLLSHFSARVQWVDDLARLLFKWLCWYMDGKSRVCQGQILFKCNFIKVIPCDSYGSNQEGIKLWRIPSVAPARFDGFTQNIEANQKKKCLSGRVQRGGLLLCSTHVMKSGHDSQLWLRSLVYSGAFCRLWSCKYPWANMWSWLEESSPHRVH